VEKQESLSFTHSGGKHSLHLTLGTLRRVFRHFPRLSLFQLDGFAVPTPAQVTQAVGRRQSIRGTSCGLWSLIPMAIEIRPFRQEDFDLLLHLSNQAMPFTPQENAEWLEM
jgi:hypothetical protein